MANNKAFKVKNGLELEAYSKAISDTAVDIFVYDTRKDSDGGAWRKRTQGTSWYNETLNTATRGSRKEFPAVAVIVAESNQVTIYDGDDPDLPMWMVFNNSGLVGYTASVTSLSMINGVLSFGGSGGLFTVKFLSEIMRFRQNGNDRWQFNISSRNTLALVVNGLANHIVNSAVNDVAMTVLPNAPIDAATGLPVPTIAVATDGGVSVIKDDGTVVDITAGSYSVSGLIAFTKEQNLLYGFDFSADRSRYIHIQNIPTADTNIGTYGYERGSDDLEFYTSRPESNPDLFVAKYLASSEQFSFAGDYVGGNVYGLAKLDRNQSNPDKGMVAFIDAEHNTGYQVGDIKLATLSDTDATNVTGSELLTNGTFDTDISGWSVNSGATVAHEATSPANSIRVNATDPSGTPNGVAYQSFPTEIGKTYTATATGTKGSGNYGMGVGTSSTNLSYGWDGYQSASNVTQSYTFVATATTAYVSLLVDSTDGTQYAFFDNISVRLAEEDRSVNGNGLQVFGTVTKSAVATGADLVGYSGFSQNGNTYLEQPYNSDLDFGTGDFCVMGWVKGSNTGNDYILSRARKGDGSNPRFGVRGSTDQSIAFNISGSLYADTGVYVGDQWQQFVFVRRNGTIYSYINGEQKASAAASGTLTLSDSSFFIGTWGTSVGSNSLAFGGYVSLVRVSATAPSPEQIKKIYEDEKVLFQEGAQATLYGSSDAVTALAYDDSTNLLHVGTSAGRSVFQGLRRVDNTTTAVGAAISASNGLVADE